MTARNHAPDWSAKGQAFRSLDGTPVTLGVDWRAAKPGHQRSKPTRAFKRAAKNYRKYVTPMADEPMSLLDSWIFLAFLGAAIGLVGWLRVSGLLQ